MSESRTTIERVIEESGEPMTPTEVADALDKKPQNVKQRMWHMAKDGQLVSRDGRYSAAHNLRNPITEEGDPGYAGYGSWPAARRHGSRACRDGKRRRAVSARTAHTQRLPSKLPPTHYRVVEERKTDSG